MARQGFSYTSSRFNILTSLLEVLNRGAEDSTDTVIAQYLLDHYAELEELNIYDVASECFCSRSSIQRFSKDIGFDSFTDLKLAHAALGGHLEAVGRYAADQSFVHTVIPQMNLMMNDITAMTETPAFHRVLDTIHESEVILLVAAATSDTGVHKLQEELFLAGKRPRIANDLHGVQSAGRLLRPEDLTLVLSTTGIYALAVQDSLATIRSKKVLLTMNASESVAAGFDDICLMSDRRFDSPSIPETGIRDVYTRYAMPFFLDLLMHEYLRVYGATMRS